MSCSLVAALGLLALGCSARSGPAPAQASGSDEVLARIDGEAITAGDLQRRIDALDSYSRARFSAPEQRRKFLENLVRFEVLAREAQKRGYDKDPEVQRTLKNQMISAMLQKEVDDKLKPEDIPQAEVERYYQAHTAEFRQPEEVRVSQIFTIDGVKAERAVSAARALRGKPEPDKAFRELVAQLSEDEDSKSRGGDLTFFDRGTTMYPKALVDAAFALQDMGQVSPAVRTDRGYHILVLTQRRPAFTRALPEVSRDIRKRLMRVRQDTKMEELVTEMRKRLKVEIYEDQLAKVQVSPATPAASGGRP
jgi:peptidyl-prolyl cis-trans isomerase C